MVITGWSIQMLLTGAAWIGAAAVVARAWGPSWRLIGAAAACVGLSLIGLAPSHLHAAGGSLALWWTWLGVVSMAGGWRLGVPALRAYGLVAMSGALLWLLGVDLGGSLRDTELASVAGLVISGWTFRCALGAAAWFAASWFIGRAPSKEWRLAGAAASCVGFTLVGLAPLHADPSIGPLALWWTIVGLAAVAWSMRAPGVPVLRVFGLGAMSGALLWLLGGDLVGSLRATPIAAFGGLVLSGWAVRCAAAAVAWFAASRLIGHGARDRWRVVGRVAWFVGCSLVALVACHAETMPGAMGLWWAIVGFAAVLYGRRRGIDDFAQYGLVLMALAVVGLLGVGVPHGWNSAGVAPTLGLVWTALSAQMAAAGVLVVVVSRLQIRDGRDWAVATGRVGIGIACVLAASLPAHAQTDLGAMAMWWAALGVAASMAHRFDRRSVLDVVGMCFPIAAGLLWMLAFLRPGWMATDAPPGLHPGFGVAIVLVLEALVLGAWMRRTAPLDSARRGLASFALAYAGSLLFASTSLEVGRIAAAMFHGDPTSRAAVLSIWWGVFAIGLLAVGFVRRAPVVRYVGLGLLMVAAAKAVFFDLAQVSMGWRVVSFLGLGLLMVGVAVVYQRVASLVGRAPGPGRGPGGDPEGGGGGHEPSDEPSGLGRPPGGSPDRPLGADSGVRPGETGAEVEPSARAATLRGSPEIPA